MNSQSFAARLKSCPDTKHQFCRSVFSRPNKSARKARKAWKVTLSYLCNLVLTCSENLLLTLVEADGCQLWRYRGYFSVDKAVAAKKLPQCRFFDLAARSFGIHNP